MHHLILMDNDGIFPPDVVQHYLKTTQPPNDPETIARLRDSLKAFYAHVVHQDSDHEDYPLFRYQFL